MGPGEGRKEVSEGQSNFAQPGSTPSFYFPLRKFWACLQRKPGSPLQPDGE